MCCLFSPCILPGAHLSRRSRKAPRPRRLCICRPQGLCGSSCAECHSAPLVKESKRLVMCTVCGGMIRGGNLRLGVPRAFKFGTKFDWMHPACYTDSCTRMQRPQGGASDFNGFQVRANTCLRDVSRCFVVSRLHILYAFPPADFCCPARSNWTNKHNKASSDR